MRGRTVSGSIGYVDPFLGKCIHGVSGAYHNKGRLENPNCSLCRAEKRISEAKASATSRGE